MSADDAGVVRSTREITTADQRAVVAQCSRCVVRDASVWIVPGVLAGVAVGLVQARTPGAVVAPVVLGLLLVLIQVAAARRWLRSSYPVGLSAETVIGPHRLEHLMGEVALPQVTGIRPEGRLLRLECGKDHSHVLPDHVDVELVRRHAGVAAPAPGPGSSVVVVPAGLGARAARRVLVWRVWHDNNVLFALGAGALVWALGQPELATTLVVAQTGSLVAAAAADRRAFDRTYPASIPVEAQWRGRILELRSTQGQWTVDLDPVTSATRAGDLVVVRRRGMPPLVLPDVLVGDELRGALLRSN